MLVEVFQIFCFQCGFTESPFEFEWTILKCWFSKNKSLKIEQVKFAHHCWASDIDNGMINLKARFML